MFRAHPNSRFKRFCQASEHDAGYSGVDDGLSAAGKALEITGEPTKAVSQEKGPSMIQRRGARTKPDSPGLPRPLDTSTSRVRFSATRSIKVSLKP